MDYKTPFHNDYPWFYPPDHPGFVPFKATEEQKNKAKEFKFLPENLVSSEPEWTFHKVNETRENFLVIACDGLFEVVDEQEIAEMVSEWWRETAGQAPLDVIAANLVDYALRMGSSDNVTCIVVKL